MASTREIKSKKGIGYKIEVSKGYDINGKKLRETATFYPDVTLTPKQREKALERFVYEFEQKVTNGKYFDGEKLTLMEFSEKWLLEYGKQQLEVSTYSSYDKILHQRILPKLGHLKLSKITPLQLQSFYNAMTKDGCRHNGKAGAYSHGTIKKTHVVLSSLLSTAVQWQILNDNPCAKVKIPKSNEFKEGLANRFTLAETKLFLQALDKSYQNHYKGSSYQKKNGDIISIDTYTKKWIVPLQLKIFYYMAIFSGCRKGELLGLSWSDIDFANNMINITSTANCIDRKVIIKAPKTKNSIRKLSLPSFIMQLVKQWKKQQTEYRISIGSKWVGNDWIFIQEDGKLMNVSTPYNTFKTIISKYNETTSKEELKLPTHVTLHGLRHTNASLLVKSGKLDIESISENLGHSKTSTTMNYYVHSDDETKKETANILEEMILDKQA